MKLILASGSQNRKQLLDLARIPYSAVTSRIDESKIRNKDIRKRVISIARAKVDEVAKTRKGLILGADGVNLVNGEVLEKPKTERQAISMLRIQSGKLCSFLTGYFILNTESKKTYKGWVETFYKFRNLSSSEINRYVKSEPVYQWAAAFSPANSMAISFVEYVKGSYSNFNYSIPLEKIIPILIEEGVIK